MSIADNIARIRETIADAENRAGRAASSVRLMAVSKFNPADSVLAAVEAGMNLFGENRVQESVEKFPAILKTHEEVELHLIGSLQRNKVKLIVPFVTCIQSVDRIELLGEIEKHASASGRTIDVLFEFQTGEETKSGFSDSESLYRSLDALALAPHVRCRGLMTMAPFTEDRDLVRHSFRTLAFLRDECRKRYPLLCFDELSMGMSADYGIAIEEGSTLIRIGRAIFGERS